MLKFSRFIDEDDEDQEELLGTCNKLLREYIKSEKAHKKALEILSEKYMET